jgi:hypothetical protein
MTLIVPFVCDQFVALASDRRITWQIGGASSKWEDTENKAVVLAGHHLLGYTGFARLGGVKTEQWVVEKLVGRDPSSYFHVLREEAERAVNAMNEPLDRSGHAFVAVGYVNLRPDPVTLHAAAITISNAVGDSPYGTWNPTRTFSARRTPPLAGSSDFRINAYGASPPRPVIDETVDLIKRYRKHHPDRVLGVLQLLVTLVRRVAAATDTVSMDVSVSVLPRVAVPAETVSARPSRGLVADPITELWCMYVPGDADAEDAEVYVPATVSPGIAMRGGEIWTTKPPWWKG